MPPERVLLITGDRDRTQPVAAAFGAHGFLLSCDRRAEAGALEDDYSLVLVDAAAGEDVAPLIHRVRRRSAVPLMVITTAPTDPVRVLESGADDCVGRHVAPEELVARARALLRRARHHVSPGDTIITVGALRVEPSARAAWLDGLPLTLTATEFDLLVRLARAAGRIVPRDELTAAVFGREPSPLDRALDVHVSRLRRKLREHGREVVTVRGAGYLLRTRWRT